MTERELLTAGLRELGVAECPSAADNLLRYSEILREKNKVMNLTAITEFGEVVQKHFLDFSGTNPLTHLRKLSKPPIFLLFCIACYFCRDLLPCGLRILESPVKQRTKSYAYAP